MGEGTRSDQQDGDRSSAPGWVMKVSGADRSVREPADDQSQMRQLAKLMLAAGCTLFLLALFPLTGSMSKATEVGDTLALLMSGLVALSGLVYLLVTRNAALSGEARMTLARGRAGYREEENAGRRGRASS